MTTRSLVRRFVVLRALRWLPLGVATPFLVLLPQHRGLGLGAIGVAFAVHGTVAILLEVPSGGLADAIGRRAALILGGVITAAGLTGFALATGLAGFVLAAATIAAGRALMSGSLEAWFVDELHTLEPGAALHRPLAAGSTAEGLGAAAGAAIGGFIPLFARGLPTEGAHRVVELSVPMLVAAVAAIVYALAVVRYVEEAPRTRSSGWWRIARDAAALSREGVRVAGRSRDLRLLLTIAAALGLVMAITELLWQPRLHELLGGDASNAAPVFGVLAAVSLIAFSSGAALSARIARWTGRRRAFVGAFVVLAATLALLAVAPTAAPFCAAYLACFAALGVADPLYYAMLHDGADSATRATVGSADGLASQLGGLGGNLGLAPLAATAGIGAAWTVAALAALAAATVASVVVRSAVAVTPRPRPAAPSGAA